MNSLGIRVGLTCTDNHNRVENKENRTQNKQTQHNTNKPPPPDRGGVDPHRQRARGREHAEQIKPARPGSGRCTGHGERLVEQNSQNGRGSHNIIQQKVFFGENLFTSGEGW